MTMHHRWTAAAVNAAAFLLSTKIINAQHQLEPTLLPNAAPTAPSPVAAPTAPAPDPSPVQSPTQDGTPTAVPTYGPASDQSVDIIFVTVLGGIVVVLLFYFWTGWMLYERDVDQRMLKVSS